MAYPLDQLSSAANSLTAHELAYSMQQWMKPLLVRVFLGWIVPVPG